MALFIDSEKLAPAGQLAPSNDINKRAHETDMELRKLTENLGEDLYADFVSGPGTQMGNPDLFAKSLTRIGDQLGTSGLSAFGIEQGVLFSMNEQGKIWNPAYFANRAPIVNNFIPLSLDVVPPGIKPGNHEFNELTEDARRMVEASINIDSQINQTRHEEFIRDTELFTETNAADELKSEVRGKNLYEVPDGGAAKDERRRNFTISELVDGPLEGGGSLSKIATNKDIQGTVRRTVTDVTELFDNTRLPFESRPAFPEDTRQINDPSDDPVAQATFNGGIIPAEFPGEKGEYGDKSSLRHPENVKPSEIVSDDEAYVPLSFTDLRKISGNKVRTIYFRPFITSFTENLSPEWNNRSFYGRPDPVITYGSTTRNIFLGFELHAFSPEDVKVIHEKLFWLKSLVYPEYTRDLILKAAPVCRMRVGDIIKSNAVGLPGVIESIDFDYGESLWELKKNSKVPRTVKVSLSFIVLHDSLIGRDAEGQFGGLGYTNSDGEFVNSARDGSPTTGDLRGAADKKSSDTVNSRAFMGFVDVFKKE